MFFFSKLWHPKKKKNSHPVLLPIVLMKVLGHIFYILAYPTTKKWGYPSIFKTAGIALKSARIGSEFLSRRFFSRHFKPLAFECGDRVTRTCTSAFQKRTLFRRFYLCQDSLYKNVNITYTSAFESAGIGTTYASAFKSAGIGLESI